MEKSVTELRNPKVDANNWKPRSVVWELTLACNLRCDHCGSRAGKKLPDEMSTDECLDVVRQLHELGVELITLSGGEPTLREDWDSIAREISHRNILVNMVTNGVYGNGLTAKEVALRASAAGMCNLGVSLDGAKEVHDTIRGAGTFDRTRDSVRTFVEKGLSITIMTTVNRLNVRHLWKVRDIAMELGARAIRFQLAKPMGTMNDHRDWVIDPGEVALLLPDIARMKQKGGIDVRVGDSLGYYGKPDKVLRDWSWRRKKTRWGGCQAGMQAIGIQANGDIKGCLSLQAGRGDADPFVEGNVRLHSLKDIWYRPGAFSYNRDFSIQSLTHDCKECDKATICRGGARCISTAMDGTLSHDEYCYYRLCGEGESTQWLTAGKTAAAAAVLALAVNTAACDNEKKTPSSTGSDDTSSEMSSDSDAMDTTNSTEPDYSAGPDPVTDNDDTASDTDADSAVLDYAVEPDTDEDTAVMDYAVEPDTGADTAVMEYGVEPDTGADTAVMDYAVEPDTEMDTAVMDYAVEPDTGADTAVMEYGVTPDYAVEPDAGLDSQDTAPDSAVTDYGVTPDYAVEPDTSVDSEDTAQDTAPVMDYAVTPDYAVEPDTGKDTGDTAPDTALMDYGLFPD
jgi:radical SAM protein with 4Fe4S-binding SPASM domain